MISWFCSLNPIIQALLATTFTFLVTVLGSSIVLLFKNVNKNVMDISLSLSAGVMLAASFFSLINPSIEMATELNMKPWLVSSFGIFLGGLILFLCDYLYNKKKNKNDNYKRNTMLLLSISLHNIPEGMAVGVAFGSLIYGLEGATLTSACMLALGIGIQNFPEGSAVSLPLRSSGYSVKKSFILGGLSAIVEPLGGIIGAILVIKIKLLLPYLLAFSAGAMLYVITKELIPESQSNKNKSLMTLFAIAGFLIMMMLDVALG